MSDDKTPDFSGVEPRAMFLEYADHLKRLAKAGRFKGTNMAGNKRCKNCKMWQPYQGNEPTLPARSKKACTLRFAYVKQKDGQTVMMPSRDQRHPKGEHFGKRTSPNFTCKYHVPTNKPATKPVVQPDDDNSQE